MPNPVVDPGFEVGSPAWVLSGSAERRTAIDAHGGSWFAYLFGRSGLGATSSTVEQGAIPVSLGERRVLTFWYRCPSQGSTQLGVGTNFGLSEQPPASALWTEFVSDPFDILGATAEILFNVPIPPGAAGSWEVDDVALPLESDLTPEQIMRRGRSIVFAALVAKLRSINGSVGGYTYDLTNRVRTNWKDPSESGDQLFTPYLAVPLIEKSTFEKVEKHLVKASWREIVFGYLAEKTPDGADASASIETLELMEDIHRALLEDPTFGGVVRYSNLVEGDPTSFGDPEASLVVVCEFEDYFTRDQIGPSAV